MSKNLIILREEGVGKIIFNDPGNLNSLTPEVIVRFAEAVEELDADQDVRVIVISGKGRAFCSGANLSFVESLFGLTQSEIKETVYKHFVAGAKALRFSSKPTIASVRGPAVGAGCELAIACDFRIVSETAMFSEVWINLGLICPLGGMFLLPRIIGLTRATDMLMTGKQVKGEEAEHIGLANQCVPDEALEEETVALAKRLAGSAPLALSIMKQGLRRGMESTLASEWEFNVSAQSMLLKSEDCKEGVAAIKERRRPKFRGR